MFNLVFISLVSVAVILGFMILIHEFGHYAVAKLLGVRVEQFAIGFGKRLVGFRKGETDYRINAIPLGGYVKMSGENPMDRHTDDPREFLNHSRWHRFLIAIAGPAMNILLAIVLLAGVFFVHPEYAPSDDDPAIVGSVKPDSPAAKIGVQAGDRITKIDGIENPNWEEVLNKDAINVNQPLHVIIQRGTTTFEKDVVPQPVTVNQIGSSGWFPSEPIIVGTLEPDLPAAKAGIKLGDKIIAVDGRPLVSMLDLVDTLQANKTHPLDLTVERGGETLHFAVQPVLTTIPGTSQGNDWLSSFLRKIGLMRSQAQPEQQRYRIGFIGAPAPAKVERLSLGEAFSRSVSENKNNSVLLLELVGKLVQRKVSLKTVSGPIGIAQMTGQAAQAKGWAPLLILTCLISLNLGIFNLLPIPIMDGGVILLLFIETLMRRDISLPVKERIYQAAFVFLVLFAIIVIFNDISKLGAGLP
jgi:regulator of sigma E protease